MKTEECFSCDFSLGCKDCPYRMSGGYARTKKGNIKRTNESWNHNHPDDLMPQKGRCIHHKNENKLDDSRENLQKLTVVEHKKLHMNGKQIALGHRWNTSKRTEEQIKDNSKRMKLYWEEVKAGNRERKENINWKGGPPHCVDCGKKITHHCKRCWSCHSKKRKVIEVK